MLDKVTCPHCLGEIGWEFIRLNFQCDEGVHHCYHCGKSFTLVTENTVKIEWGKGIDFNHDLPVLEIGETVRLINEEHPWRNEIGLICDRKHKHYRLEIRGKKIWVPEDWVKETNESLADSDK